MNLQIALVLLIGIISSLNANLYEEYEYEETDSNDYYRDYDEYFDSMRFKGMQTLYFAKTILFLIMFI